MSGRPRTPFFGVFVVVATLAVLVLPGSSSGAAPASRVHEFPDVPASSPFHDDISWLAEGGFASGYPDGTFRPAAAVSRQTAVQMLWLMSGSPLGPFPDEPYSDVGPGHPFLAAIEWAAALDVIGGFPDGRFRPTAPVSRQALGAVLHRLSGIEGYYSPQTFTDVPGTHPFRYDIWWWTASGQADGYSDGSFRPTETVSRQAAAKFFHNFHSMLGGHWPYHAHSHTCTDPVTPEQEQAAADLIAATAAPIATEWPTLAAAQADGFHLVGPILGGFGGHYVNSAYQHDGITLDPTKPEVLMIRFDGVTIGAMFTTEEVGVEGERVGGCLTLWHAHEDICFDKPFLEGGTFVGLADSGGCPGSSMVFITPQMLHVFVDGRADPFEGIET